MEKKEKSRKLCQTMIDTPGVLELFKNEARCTLLYDELTHDRNPEVIERLYDKKLQKYVKATRTYPARQSLLYAYYTYYDVNEKKANACYETLKKLVDTHAIKVEALIELENVKKLKSQAEENA
ncbi:hypothetical protein P261_00183 [Lachnospiraceae bacterium TWA4]|nr:hypothetical protein P261_00183 [Lachnospiraceae bacterium TWA4]